MFLSSKVFFEMCISPNNANITHFFVFQGTRNRMSSSSSYFRKFAQDNAGSPNFRRPEPKDESAKKANAIFKKYSSLGSTSKDATDNNKGEH